MTIKILAVTVLSVFSSVIYSQVLPKSTGVEQKIYPGNKTVSIWPIPAKENFYISLGSSIPDKGLVCIYDLSGKLMKKEDVEIEIGTNYSKINTIDLNAGLYLVTVNSSEVNFTKKIVLQ